MCTLCDSNIFTAQDSKLADVCNISKSSANFPDFFREDKHSLFNAQTVAFMPAGSSLNLRCFIARVMTRGLRASSAEKSRHIVQARRIVSEKR